MDSRGTARARIAAAVRRERERAGLSQEALATKVTEAGFPMVQQTIARIEGGRRRVDADELSELARAMDISMEALMRPPGVAIPAAQIIDTVRRTRAAHAEVTRQARIFRDGQERLQQLVAGAEQGGTTADLSEEISRARDALKLSLDDAVGEG